MLVRLPLNRFVVELTGLLLVGAATFMEGVGGSGWFEISAALMGGVLVVGGAARAPVPSRCDCLALLLAGTASSISSAFLVTDQPLHRVGIAVTPVVTLLLLAQIVRLKVRADRLTRHADEAALDGATEARERMAVELHDNVLQTSAGMLLLLRSELQKDASSVSRDVCEELAGLLSQEVRWLKVLSGGSAPMSLDQEELVPALAALVQRCRRGSAADIRFDVVDRDAARPIRGEVSVATYRIVQEALQNALRHGEASRIDVKLIMKPTKVVARVVDDGVGFDPGQARGGVGMTGLHHRARNLGGTVEIRSGRPGQVGTCVQAVLPRPMRRGGRRSGAVARPGAPETW